MGKLLKLQMRNLFRSKFFYVCLAFLIVTEYVGFRLISKMDTYQTTTIVDQVLATLKSGNSLVFVIITCLFVCMDFADGTVKNIIARGYTRRQFFMSKYIVSLIGIYATLLVSVITDAILFRSRPVGDVNQLLLFLPVALITIAVMIAFYVMVAYICESKGTAIAVNLFVPTFAGLLFSFINSNLKLGFDISKYWIDSLVNLVDVNNITKLAELKVGLLSLAYIVLFLGLGMFLTKKREIK